MIKARAHIAAMSPYAIADLTAPDGQRLISLSQNESLRPPSPRAIEAAARAIGGAQLYPDPDWTALRQALATQHGLQAANILCGNGSMELILALALAFAGKDSAILAPAHGYPFFRTVAQLACARFDTAPETERQVSVDALLAAVQPDTRLLFLANPGNPTGTRISKRELARLRKGLREDILLIIDEAYGEFADHLDEPSFDLTERGGTVVLRSFSKAYGLAGLRIGWGLFPPQVACELRKVLNPNTVSVAAQAAATAAVADQAYMRETCAGTRQLAEEFRARLQDAGFRTRESFANFVLIPFDDPAAAKRADAFLRARGVFLRPQAGAGLPHCLRATIADVEKLGLAAQYLEEWAKEEMT